MRRPPTGSLLHASWWSVVRAWSGGAEDILTLGFCESCCPAPICLCHDLLAELLPSLCCEVCVSPTHELRELDVRESGSTGTNSPLNDGVVCALFRRENQQARFCDEGNVGLLYLQDKTSCLFLVFPLLAFVLRLLLLLAASFVLVLRQDYHLPRLVRVLM